MRIAIVTGGSRGLGEALCRCLGDDGYEVIEFSRGAPHAFSSTVDLADPYVASKAVAERLAPISAESCTDLVVFNNAGTLMPMGPTSRKPLADAVSNLNVNLVSAIAVLTEIMRHFRDAQCRKVLVNVSSGAALKGYAGWSLYCASKAGMEGFIRALAVEEEYSEHPFTAISIDPGVIDTDMQARIRTASVADFPEVERFKARKLAGGLASAHAVAVAAIRLALSPNLRPGDRHDLLVSGRGHR